MPKFMDYHETMPPLPPEAVQMMTEKVQASQTDDFGVKPINVIMGGGHAWCMTEAPNAEAVCKSHEANGIDLNQGDVTEVMTLA